VAAYSRTDYIASLLDIKDAAKTPEEFQGYLQAKAAAERRELRGDEKVAIFSVAGTQAHLVAFLDPHKTIGDLEAELAQSHVKMDLKTLGILGKYLSSQSPR
jgi:hypothetical protein